MAISPPCLRTQFGACTWRISQSKSFIPLLYSQMRSFNNFSLSTASQLLQAQQCHHFQSQIHNKLSFRTNVLVSSQARTLHSTSHKQARPSSADKTAKDDAIPFLQSQAHKFRVDDAYTVDSAKDRLRQRFALPLGLGIFAVIMYFGFFRDYGTKDQSVMGFLTRDIGDRLPDDVRQRIYSEVDQSKLSDQTSSAANDK